MVERIIDLIEKNGITAAKLLTDLGMARSSMSEWKKGKAKPSTDAIIKIADYFGVSTDYLLTDTTEEDETKNTETSSEVLYMSRNMLHKIDMLNIEQLKIIDLEARNYKFIETAPDELLQNVLDIIVDFLE